MSHGSGASRKDIIRLEHESEDMELIGKAPEDVALVPEGRRHEPMWIMTWR